MTSDHQKIAIVTGANAGLGFETTLGLAKEGYKVIMACRNAEKANQAMAGIRRKAKSADLEYMNLDLIDRDNIKAFAAAFSDKYDHLDLLVNNAGVMAPPYTVTKNDLELQFDANHMGHFYLTSLLFDKLDQDHETRIVNVASLAGKREGADIFFDNLNFVDTYDAGPEFMGLKGMTAYSQSKLANILFNQELNDRLAAAGKNIKAIVVHPGASNTSLGRNMSWKLRLIAPIITPLMGITKPAKGAESSLYAALRTDVKSGDFIGPTGKKEYNGKPGHSEFPPKALDKALSKKLWTFSEKHLGVKFKI